MRTNGGPDGYAPDRAADELADAVQALLRSWRALTQRAAEIGAPSTMAVLELVRLLGEDERRLSEIAALRGVDQSVVSRQISELQAKGLVCRRPDPADRRASLVRLTPSGQDLLAEVAELRRDWLHGALARLPETDVLAAARLVTAVAEEIAHRAAEPAGSPAPPARPGRPALTSTRGTTA
ncbi:MarR family winged helix-turn-helix transcriptional regulator [Pseudonocardia humida]|uniref:Winged helix-turn-helix transcriptional regulator n=1 Tax=Pseudonocardia humida TaxID=2800819 RepID=A0ABT0ZWI9_9PSEU|nr:MarR family winged helix-turn-helix transcriptional regulator [Pseudonocardia humida]MCO1655086.1 winged helix-turn-helix transcriptional regulator [Pseudonocardia humida]